MSAEKKKKTTMQDVCKHYGVSTLRECPKEASIYPEFYPNGSLIWTLERLDCLPMDKRIVVCAELREVFLVQGATAYGEHLNAAVKQHGDRARGLAVKSRGHEATRNLAPAWKARIDAIRAGGSGSRILAMSDSARGQK